MATANSTATYKDIPGHPGYRVGDDGSVWSCWRRKGLGRGRGTTRVMGSDWQRLKTQRREDGHLQVNLGQPIAYVHCLVLLAFVGPCPPGLEGCHNDGDPANNRLDNLRWDTHAGNAQDRVRHGTSDRGERNPGAKLTEDQVREIRAARGRTKRELAAEYGVTPGAIQLIRNGRRWAHLGPDADATPETRHLPRLTAEQVKAIRAEYAAGGVSQAALGAKYGVSHTLIRNIVTGKAWKGTA